MNNMKKEKDAQITANNQSNLYKSILWIEDCNIYQASLEEDDFQNVLFGESDIERNEEFIKSYFGANSVNVQLCRSYKDALSTLANNAQLYNLVVFDMDMTIGIEQDELGDIFKQLASQSISVSEEDLNIDKFVTISGVYLYMYLKNLGYPSNRMVILTGNNPERPKNMLKQAYIKVNEDDFFLTKTAGSLLDTKIWEDRFFKNNYYAIRRLVYKACEFWKDHLFKHPNDDIAFNNVYFDKSFDIIEVESFLNVLNRVEMLFPVVKPYKEEQVYYQAMQVLTAFHEESAKINILNDSPIKKYHQSLRFFRNWAAHNKFQNTEINIEIFALLFCLCLRTYFVFQTNQIENETDLSKKIYIQYEKEVFENALDLNLKFTEEDIKMQYQQDWNKHRKRLERNKCNYYVLESMDKILLKSGECRKKTEKMTLCDCLIPLLSPSIIREDVTIENEKSTLHIVYGWNENRIHNASKEDPEEKIVSYATAIYLKNKE